MTKRLILGLCLLTLNASYLYTYQSPTVFYVGNLFLHLGLGIVLLVLFLPYLKQNFSSLVVTGKAAAAVLLLGGASGILLIFTGTSRPYHWLLNTHIILCLAGIGLLLVHLVSRRQKWIALAAVTVVALAFPPLVWKYQKSNPGLSEYIINPTAPPVSMEHEGAGAESPFFPSSATTDVGHTIPSEFFMEPESCARSGCHPDIFEQWESSAHHFSSFNNQWYRKAIEYMQDTVGTQPSKWCAGCHDHAVFFNGMMDTPVKELLDRPEAHAGLTCTSCHSIVSVGSSMGNGNFVIEYPPLHDLATSENWFLRNIHDFVVHVDPGPHKQTFLKPLMRNNPSEYCSACHKVHLDVPVNDYRWFRGFNEYDGWQSSGVSGQGARSFYYPPEPMQCKNCHMPLVESEDAGNVDGYVHNHRFPGANTALPTANKDEKQLETVTDFLQNNQVSVDIFAISEADAEEGDETYRVPSEDTLQVTSGFAEGDTLGFAVGRGTGYTEARHVLAPIDRVQPVVKRGETVRIDAVVRTRNVGHFFPGGTVDAFDVWVELQAVDNKGQILFWSGHVPEDEDGRKLAVDPGAHFYKSFMLDERGNPINKRNAWAARSVLYVRLIPPGAADTVHFRLHVPEDAGDEIHLTAKVNYRKFAWWNTQWAFAGVRDPENPAPAVAHGYDDGKWVFEGDTSNVSGKLKEIPDLPITTMASAETSLRVIDSDAEMPEQASILHADDMYRWNDYGIGLLLQGDLKAAEEIFQRVTEINPDYADGWVNVGRVRVQEGRTEEAQEVLNRALEIDPELAKTHFFMGMTFKTQGNYEKALEHFHKAESKYPRDRVVLNQIGRILFLQRDFEQAVETFHRVLRIDPEDLQAHYNLMLCYRGLGDRESAQREQQLYLRFKADESSQMITGPYRLAHKEDNNERQAIHEHRTYPLDTIENSYTRLSAENQSGKADKSTD